ncbi:MAG: hypothetical protein P8X50_05355 [Maritimibacter sp.]
MFKKAEGIGYYRFMRRLHKSHLFEWYMEVGCRNGRVFSNSRSKTIAVDPFFRAERNIINNKPALHIFQQTSDDFFSSAFLKAAKVKLSFSFLDGMHLFEFLLRDFMNTEQASDQNGVIALHDCLPFGYEMTTRDLNNLPKGAWTGDVWKLIPILKAYRPDLKLTVLDAAPTGLVLISNLKPSSRVLATNYDEIVAKYEKLTLEEYGLEAFYDLFEIEDTEAMIEAGFPLFDKIKLDPSKALNPEKVSP